MTFSRLRYLLPVAVLSLLSSSAFSQSECEIPGLFDSCTSSVSFQDYNYDIIEIGDQCWFQENLRSEYYLNGELIPGDNDGSDWGSTMGLQSYYDNDLVNLNAFGRLYNWYAVDDERGLCPSGWHVPSDAEFTILTDALGGEAVAGGHMKEEGTEHWSGPNTGADNSSGFKGLGAGNRYEGTFNSINNYGYFWSSSPTGASAWTRRLSFQAADAERSGFYFLRIGYSVRCLRD